MSGVTAEAGLAWRRALYGGLLSSLGATTGWLLWIALQAFQQDWRVLFAPAVGAVLGLLLHWLVHYVRVAGQEASGPPGPEAPGGRGRQPAVAAGRIGAVALLALGVACENLLGDLVHQMLVPLLASVATLFPVGFVFAWLFQPPSSSTSSDDNLLARVWGGALAGALAAAAAMAVHLLMGAFSPDHRLGDALGSILAWWVLLGIGFGVTLGDRSGPHPLAPLGGVAIALGLVLVLSIPSLYSWVRELPGPLRALRLGVEWAVDGMLASPELPAAFWLKAEEQIAEAKAKSPGGLGRELGWGAVLARWIGCPELQPPRRPEAPLPRLHAPPRDPLAPRPPPDFSRLLGALKKKEADRTAEDNQLLRQLAERWSREVNPALPGEAAKPVPVVPGWPEDPSQRRQDRLCRELRLEFGSGLVRSWFVILLFSVGLGVAPLVEGLLRPPHYADSQTRKNDQKLAVGLVVLLAVAVGLVRWLSA
jgi:hypothetical protein